MLRQGTWSIGNMVASVISVLSINAGTYFNSRDVDYIKMEPKTRLHATESDLGAGDREGVDVAVKLRLGHRLLD